MTILIDTHVLIWFLQGSPQLGATARALIQDPANVVLVSVATCWEIAIKAATGKLRFAEPVGDLLRRELPKNKMDLLPITLDHATAVESLPLHHRDPFDRLLAAQALAEGIPLVSSDAAFDAYGVDRRR
jgi:PIN domain nuclease of toxin-antitoxin system